jgi:signal transduction histidine kinase
MAQEALRNVEKHARAREAVLTARNGDKNGIKTLLIFVSDDGKGLGKTGVSSAASRPDKGENSHLGIRAMYERAAILGGGLSFISEEGRGLTVRIEIPLERGS